MGLRQSLKMGKVGKRGAKVVPVHVERRRVAVGRIMRNRLLGYEDERGYEHPLLKRWGWFVGHWCGKGFFRYDELLALGLEWKGVTGEVELFSFVEDHPEGWGIGAQAHAWDQECLLGPFSRYVQRVADGRTAEEVLSRREEFQEQLSLGRAKEAMRELVYNGFCPVCGCDVRKVDVCGHGYHKARLGPGGTILMDPASALVTPQVDAPPPERAWRHGS